MSLKSAGFDAVILVNERFLNQISGALFYTGFLRITKELDLLELVKPSERDTIDPALVPFLKMGLRIRMVHEPSIDFMPPVAGGSPVRMKLFMKLRIMVTLWDGLEMPFDGKLSIIADCGVERIPVNIGSGVGIYGEPVVTVPDPAGVSDSLLQIFKKMGPDYIEPGAYALLLHFAHSEIETFSISFQQHKMQGLTIDLDDLVGTLLKAYFQEEGNAFGIGLPSFGVYLPDMDKIPENRFYADLAAIKVVNGQALAVAFNFLGRSGGNADDLSDFLRNCSIGLAIPEAAVNRLIAFGWERVVKGKVMDFQKRITVDKTNSTFNTISSALNIVDRVAAELATLGILEVEYDLKCLKIDIGLSVCIPTQPRFDMMPGNIVAIGDVFAQVYLTAKVTVEAELDVEVDLTGWLPDFIPDIKAYHEHQEICVLNARVRLDKVGFTDMKAKVVFDAVGNRIALELAEMDLALDGALALAPATPFMEIPDLMKPLLFDIAKKAMLEQFKKLSISPPVSVKLSVLPWEMRMKGKKIDIDAEEMTATLDAWFEPLKKDIPNVPKYIGNANNMEVHLVGCDGLKDTYEEHQKGYHLLNDALNRGFDGCGRCLPAFHKRS